ncbi:cytosol aminopeptidase isoform X2 [Parasteatoda tepidariorum]|uniref:cytosol aminopeptidase isoform X2 n=1 Tax=Parasteatoda tepidariorum TaxID=114398 RepID=UPI001C71FAD8|nr:cytosol aminopeptidase isoform X2 [Parasteatoda tepidariorum]XP_042904965.1 cytosol aminopeptidase isoform X3 [Parasteatoda tepidariorum]
MAHVLLTSILTLGVSKSSCLHLNILHRVYSTLNYKMKGLVLGVYTEKNSDETKPYRVVSGVTNAFKDVDEKSDGKLSDLLKLTGPFYKSSKQKLLWVPTLKSNAFEYDCVSVVDLGSKDVKDDPLEEVDQKAENVRCAISGGVVALDKCSNFDDIYLDSCGIPQSVSEAAGLALYSYDELKAKAANKHKSNLHIYKYPNICPDTLQKYENGRLLAECQNFARTLMQTPANFMTPSIFASTVQERFKGTNVNIIVRDRPWIESMKMGSFLSVTRGSNEEPKFVELHYEGLPGVEKNIAFVGKGITFDSGGISIKPSPNMDKMRADMGGAACVAGTILAASALGLKINVKGFLPLCENLPSGHATKPGDVVRTMNGKTIQVDNTDAEGRLVLADGLIYAQQFKPAAVVDIATLTGAMQIALGAGATGVFSNDNNLWEALHKAGHVTGDRVWRMPLFKLYTESVTSSDLADLNNIGNPKTKAGSCTAAAFLKEFVEPGMRWMHLDIAGVMESMSVVPYLTSGMSGRPTRTLVQFLHDLEEEFSKK